jgi:casein kinase I family protein HRR25
MVHSLQNVHELNYIHRDIKPENFVIGNDGCHHIVYLLDFGLSKKYIDDLNRHIPFVENKGLVGTARYTSINSHLGTEQSRRDDLESLGYVLLYFAKGSLPWQNFQCESRSEK